MLPRLGGSGVGCPHGVLVVLHHLGMAFDDLADIEGLVDLRVLDMPSPVKERDCFVRAQITHFLMSRQNTPEFIRRRMRHAGALAMGVACTKHAKQRCAFHNTLGVKKNRHSAPLAPVGESGMEWR